MYQADICSHILHAGRKFGEDHCGDGVKHTGNSQIAYHRYSERSVILAPAQAAIKNPRKVLHERLKKHK